MGTTLHVLNARDQLNAVLPQIEACFLQSMDVIGRLIPVENLDIVVSASRRVIPQTGMAGSAYALGHVSIMIDPDHLNLKDHFETVFLQTLAHELHHAARWDGPGYGNTLGEALVSEGLACWFESEILQDHVPFYARSLTSIQLEQAKADALPMLLCPSYSHAEWFMGVGGLPMHAGYSLGYQIVSEYMAAHGSSASALVHAPAAIFLGEIGCSAVSRQH